MDMSKVNDPRLARANRAIQALAAGLMTVSPFIKGRVWVVESQSRGSTHEYLVIKEQNRWQCNCPDWEKRHEDCKHIMAVKIIEERRI